MTKSKIPSHAPSNYTCPICLGNQGNFNNETLLRKDDLVFRDELVSVYINSFFMGKNAGHVIVVPNGHFESIYTLPDKVGHRIFEVSKRMAVALRESYGCDGITTRQNNEPAGDQHAFHYHMHVYPRYDGDTYNSVLPAEKRLASEEERAEYAAKLKRFIP